MNSKWRARATTAVCAACAITYTTSLALPALSFGREAGGAATRSYWGIALLLLGWIEAIGGTSTGVAWFANPLFAVGLLILFFQRFLWAAACLGLSLALASASFGVKAVCINEAGHVAPVVGLGPGFWLWYLTIAGGLIAAVALSVIPARNSCEAVTLTDADFIR